MNKFIDLFAGIGGFRVALEKQGLACVFSSEIDNEASRVYHENFREKTARGYKNLSTKRTSPHMIFSVQGSLANPFPLAAITPDSKITAGSYFMI